MKDTVKHYGLDEISEEEQEMLNGLYEKYRKPTSYIASLILKQVIEAMEKQDKPAEVLSIVTDGLMASFAIGYKIAFEKKHGKSN